MLCCCSHTNSWGRWVEAVPKPLALHLSKRLAPLCCDLYIRCSSHAKIFRRMAMWLMERMSWGIQQRLRETTIHPSANIGGPMWTSDLRLRASHFSAKNERVPVGSAQGLPIEDGYARQRGSNDLWRKLSEQNEARALDQAQMEMLTSDRMRLGGTGARARWHWKHSVDINHCVLNFWAKVSNSGQKP